MRCGIILTVLITLCSTPALAHAHHHYYTHHHYRHYDGSSNSRPYAWCGWYMRQVKGVADASYNLARNWAHWGSNAGGPREGAVVVWPHHVGLIVGQQNGLWIV